MSKVEIVTISTDQLSSIIGKVVDERMAKAEQPSSINSDLLSMIDYVTVRQAARMLKVSNQTIRNYINSGELSKNKETGADCIEIDSIFKFVRKRMNLKGLRVA